MAHLEEETTILKRASPAVEIEEEEEAEVECGICLGLFENDPVTELLCKHSYHTACINAWLAKKLNCPTCIRPISNNDQITKYWQNSGKCMRCGLGYSYRNAKLVLRCDHSFHYKCTTPVIFDGCGACITQCRICNSEQEITNGINFGCCYWHDSKEFCLVIFAILVLAGVVAAVILDLKN